MLRATRCRAVIKNEKERWEGANERKNQESELARARQHSPHLIPLSSDLQPWTSSPIHYHRTQSLKPVFFAEAA